MFGLDQFGKWCLRWYVGGMKIKTSITLSDELLKAIDLYIGAYKSRSEFLETAARIFIEQLKKKAHVGFQGLIRAQSFKPTKIMTNYS
jgi:hypothetical protein